MVSEALAHFAPERVETRHHSRGLLSGYSEAGGMKEVSRSKGRGEGGDR